MKWLRDNRGIVDRSRDRAYMDAVGYGKVVKAEERAVAMFQQKYGAHA